MKVGTRRFRRLEEETATIRFVNGEAIFSGNSPPSEVQVKAVATEILADIDAIQTAVNSTIGGSNVTVDSVFVDDGSSRGSSTTTHCVTLVPWWRLSLWAQLAEWLIL